MNFDFDVMSGGKSVIQSNENSYKDERFFTLPKDEKGNGSAIIRFLPDGDMKEDGSMGLMKKVFKISYNNKETKRFISELSPQTIGEKCPFFEEWSKRWNAGDKEGARQFARSTRFYTNIKVLKCPADPTCEGKIFLFDMNQTLATKIAGLMQPSEEDRQIGIMPINLYNPLKGHSFILKSQKGANGFINYDASKVEDKETSIYKSKEEAIQDIKENCYKLTIFDNKNEYKTYEEIKNMMDDIVFGKSRIDENSSSVNIEIEKPTEKKKKVENSNSFDDLDEALDSLQF